LLLAISVELRDSTKDTPVAFQKKRMKKGAASAFTLLRFMIICVARATVTDFA
jgi:hypothetical protein